MRRRDLLVLFAGAVTWPLAARAQQKAMPAIGYMSGGSLSFYTAILPSFHDGLREAGYIEGQNVTVEYRWAEGHYDRLPAIAAELVGRKVDLIVAGGGAVALRSAKNATATIPIVFSSGSDPVADGLVGSLARPDGNLTGVSFLTAGLYPKRMQLLVELVPRATTLAMLLNANGPNTRDNLREGSEAAAALGKEFRPLMVAAEGDFEAAFASLGELNQGALVIQTDPFIDARIEQLIESAAHHAIPAVYGFRRFPAAGGLMSYGASIGGVYHQVGAYAGRILAGAKPSDLPVQQPTTFELVINLRTAKALGLTVPQSLAARADEVIE